MTGDEFRALMLSFAGTTEVAHFDRRAFKARVIYASLSPDELSANIRLTPDEQTHYAGLWPSVFVPIANKWGQQGWTTLWLGGADDDIIRVALSSAWQGAGHRKN